jgi:hypothetical protein
MSSFAQNIELCQILPKIWNYVKFCQKYGVLWNFAKNMELCQVLPKIYNYVLVLPNLWRYVMFWQN